MLRIDNSASSVKVAGSNFFRKPLRGSAFPLKTEGLTDIILDKECGLDVICLRHQNMMQTGVFYQGLSMVLSLGAFVACMRRESNHIEFNQEIYY